MEKEIKAKTIKEIYDLAVNGKQEGKDLMNNVIKAITNDYLTRKNILPKERESLMFEIIHYSEILLEEAKGKKELELNSEWFLNAITDYLVLIVKNYLSNNDRNTIKR